MFEHLFEIVPLVLATILARLLEQELAVTLDRGQRRPQFVLPPALERRAILPVGCKDAGDQRGELLAGRSHAFEIGDPCDKAVAPRILAQHVDKAEDGRERGAEFLAQEGGKRLLQSPARPGRAGVHEGVPSSGRPHAEPRPRRVSILPISRGSSTGLVS
jgi:hypothetical protein